MSKLKKVLHDYGALIYVGIIYLPFVSMGILGGVFETVVPVVLATCVGVWGLFRRIPFLPIPEGTGGIYLIQAVVITWIIYGIIRYLF